MSGAGESLPLKACGKDCPCVNPQPLEAFYKDKTKPDGLSSNCKVCVKARAKRWHWNNQEAANKRSALRYQANRETELEQQKLDRKANPEKFRQKDVRYYQENRESIRQKQSLYAQANSKAAVERATRFNRNNPDKVLAHTRTRRARKRGATGTHTYNDVVRQFKAQGGRCYWCGGELKESGKGKFHVDHVIALAIGGSNGPENTVCACPKCNVTKGAKTPLEFAGRLF